MSEQEIEEFLARLEEGLLESQKIMLKEKALHDESVVVMDDDDKIVSIPAKEVLRTHPELRL